jgi:endonuclease IV
MDFHHIFDILVNINNSYQYNENIEEIKKKYSIKSIRKKKNILKKYPIK